MSIHQEQGTPISSQLIHAEKRIAELESALDKVHRGIKLTGPYTRNVTMDYHGRVFPIVTEAFGHISYVNGVNKLVEINDGDALVPLGRGTWFAHYKERP